jgi:hypothetical protein
VVSKPGQTTGPLGEKFVISNTHIHSIALSPEERGGCPVRLVVGTDSGKIFMINLLSEKRGNQLGAMDTKTFGTGAVRRVRRIALLTNLIAS